MKLAVRFLSGFLVMTCLAFVASCGSNSTSAPAAPPPAAPPGPAAAPAGLSNFIDDQVGGSPYADSMYSNIINSMQQNITSNGTATVSSESITNYNVSYSNSGETLTRGSTGSSSDPNKDYGVYTYPGNWFSFAMYSNQTNDSVEVQFFPQISFYGKTLNSTDKIAYFANYDTDPTSVIEVAYTVKNPAMERFDITSNGYNLMVAKKVFTTSFH